jgi:hypothetical protein
LVTIHDQFVKNLSNRVHTPSNVNSAQKAVQVVFNYLNVDTNFVLKLLFQNSSFTNLTEFEETNQTNGNIFAEKKVSVGLNKSTQIILGSQV